MGKTKAEIRDRAATELGRLRLGQGLQHQDKERIEAAYDEVYDEIADDGLAVWPQAGPVPDKLVPYVSGLVALRCANTYGISGERMQRITLLTGSDGRGAMRRIRWLVEQEYESPDDPTDF